MPETVNIFDVVDYEDSRDFFKFVNVGDKVQGTFIKRDDNSVDSYKNSQTLVSLLQPDKTIKTVSIRHNKVGVLQELDACTIGDIIGFVFTGTKDNPGKQPTKFIRLIHDPKYRDEVWLAEQVKVENPTAGMSAAQIFPDAPTASGPVTATELNLEASLASAALSDTDKIKMIADIAKSKLGATTAEDIKNKIVEKTGLALLPINLDAILTKLNAI
jgi:hypothetical protein